MACGEARGAGRADPVTGFRRRRERRKFARISRVLGTRYSRSGCARARRASDRRHHRHAVLGRRRPSCSSWRKQRSQVTSAGSVTRALVTFLLQRNRRCSVTSPSPGSLTPPCAARSAVPGASVGGASRQNAPQMMRELERFTCAGAQETTNASRRVGDHANRKTPAISMRRAPSSTESSAARAWSIARFLSDLHAESAQRTRTSSRCGSRRKSAAIPMQPQRDRGATARGSVSRLT